MKIFKSNILAKLRLADMISSGCNFKIYGYELWSAGLYQ